MITTTGVYQDLKDGTNLKFMVAEDKHYVLAVLVNGSYITSAFKMENDETYCYNNKDAKIAYEKITNGYKYCTAKNNSPSPFQLGVASRHMFERSKISYTIEKFKDNLCGCEIISEAFYIFLEYTPEMLKMPDNTKWTQLTKPRASKAGKKLSEEFGDGDQEEDVVVRTLAEIGLEKDITWLEHKNYYVVNDDETAEQIFSAIEKYVQSSYDAKSGQYKAPVAYDVETSGLFINMFGKIGSKEKAEIERINAERVANGETPYRVDSLTGLILTVQPNVSYYFPVRNRKYKNLYEHDENDQMSEVTRKLAMKLKADYTIGQYRDRSDDMARWIREHDISEFTCDILLMERIRWILTHANIIAHNGIFEWKTTWLYNIDLNLCDDTMVLHKLIYKFTDMSRGNLGERSDLKYLTHKHFGIDQLELSDFFADYKEDDSGIVSGGKGRGKKKGSKIDFSYMDYEGSKAYAPADGDFTLQLFYIFKRELLENHLNMEYIYQVEIIVSCAIAYMEFYGHKIDENQIEKTRTEQVTQKLSYEATFRNLVGYASDLENDLNDRLKGIISEISSVSKKLKNASGAEKEFIKEQLDALVEDRIDISNQLREAIDNNPRVINMASPSQMAQLFFVERKIPFKEGETPSVGKKVLKQYLNMKNPDGTLKYPEIDIYRKWKDLDTLLTKFFENLQSYMFPGGFIFSSYGQISTATGRMSCSKPNAQQYPKSISSIVIPRENCVMVDADFSQIEYRTLVALAHEDALIERFKDPDMDYHTTMASLMYGVPYAQVTPKMRGDAKSFNFGIPYGMGFASLAILLTGNSSKKSIEEAKEKYELYFKEQQKVKKFFADRKEEAKFNEMTETLWHRFRKYSFVDKEGKYSQKLEAQALRQAGNAIIQGCELGDTLIQTKEYGIVKVEDVVNKHLHVWDGEKWSGGDILYSGKKQKCIITFSNGQKFICSPIHKFLVRSHRGKERFVECKDLLTKQNSKNPHRIVITRKYEPSDWKYSSDSARAKYTSNSVSAKNVFIDDIGDSFKEGVVLGRLASDGSIIKREVGGSCILHYVAEHELNISEKLMDYMKNINPIYADNDLRDNRNEKVNRIYAYSKSLVNEISDLDIKHRIPEEVFMDTEMLRGFLRGLFDGDGGISGSTITLTFGTQDNFEEMCRQVQKALLFFGVRSRYYVYDDRSKITIKTNDNQKFLDIIGFINEDKQEAGRKLKCVLDEHVFGQTLIPECVEITNEYVDMYDVCNTDGGYYVADGVITHNTAADIFKIAAARTFLFIRNNNLFGKFFVTNMVHDEQLTEIDVSQLDAQVVLKNLIECMELKLDGFPPLYVGAGVGDAWAHAKGKMAEIHPVLAERLIKEAEGKPIFTDTPKTPREVLDYFDKRVKDFRVETVTNYISDPKNWNEVVQPVIGNLLSLQFDYGVTDEFKAKYTEENGYTKEEIAEGLKGITAEQIRRFIEAYNLDVDYRHFVTDSNVEEDTDEDEGYDESEEFDDDGTPIEAEAESEFVLIDESNVTNVFGVDVRDIIREFGILVSKKRKTCGINVANLSFRCKDALSDYLSQHVCDEDEDGAMQVVYLKDNNTILNTECYVKGVTQKRLEQIIATGK